MNKKIYLILALMTLAVSVVPARAKKDDIKLFHVQSRLTSIEGRRVFDIVQDSQGYLWFGTDHGLFRYNGSVYRAWWSNTADDISSDFVLSLCKDSQDRLWVGTDTGINLIEKGSVVRCAPLTQDLVFHIEDYSDSLLLASGGGSVEGRNGLYLYSKETGKKHYVLDDPKFSNVIDFKVFGDYIWVPTSSGKGETYIFDRNFDLRSVVEGGRLDFSTCFYDNVVYTWGRRGLRIFSPDGQERGFPESIKAAKGKDILFIAPDSYRHRLIYGVRNEGIFAWDFQGEGTRKLWEEERLVEGTYFRLFAGDGIYCLSTALNSYKFLYDEAEMPVSLIPDSHIGELMQGFYPSPIDGSVFVTTSMGVYLFGVYTRSFRNVTPFPVDENVQIASSFIDSHGSFYVFMLDGSAKKYDWDGQKFVLSSSAKYDGDHPDLFENYSAEVCSISGNRMYNWTADLQGGSWTALRDSVSSRPVKGADGNIYFYGREGVFRMERDGTFAAVPSPVGKLLSCLYVDSGGNVWGGVLQGGLLCYSPSDGKTTVYTESSGLPEMTVRNIVEDRWHNIWLSTRHYVVRISAKDRSFSVFDFSSGFSLAYASSCSMYVGDEWRGGRVLIATQSQQIVAIDPMAESTEGDIPLSFDALFVNGERTRVSENGLVLSHDERQILLMFSGLNYSRHNTGLNYAYKLDGFDGDWVFCGQNTSASYSNLPKGHYTFRVRVQGTDGIWRKDDLTLGITIRPSFWNSSLAYFLYLVFILLATAASAIHFRRVSARREEIRRIAAEKDMNDRLYKERIGMMSNLSHEFRTPLTLIYGPAKEIENAPEVGEKYRRLAAIIDSNATWMKNLSDQIIMFNRPSKAEALKVTFNDVSALVSDIAENFAYMAEGKEIWLESHVETSVDAFCDSDKVSKILSNFIFNALKYTPKGGEVSVSMSSLTADIAASLYPLLRDFSYDGKYLEIAVKDTGPGISEENTRKIFQRYERLKNEVESGNSPEGFGIGLNYALYLARMHKGDIRVTENRPKGSIFYFIFPCEKKAWSDGEVFFDNAASLSGPELPESVSVPENKDISVLVVEDNIQLRDYIGESLSGDYAVHKASNGKEAWEFIQVSMPDVVVSDIMMPYRNGLELCHDIKSDDRFCHIPVILLTARVSVNHQIEGLSAGADVYLPKPFDPRLLKAAVSSVLENRKRLQKRLSDSPGSLATGEGQSDNSSVPDLNQRDRAFLEKFYAAVEAGYQDESFNIADLSVSMGMSYSSFYAKIKALLGQTPRDFLLAYRLDRAKEALKSGDYTVSEVAYKVGFSSLSGFSRSFKNKFGVPPSSTR